MEFSTEQRVAFVAGLDTGMDEAIFQSAFLLPAADPKVASGTGKESAVVVGPNMISFVANLDGQMKDVMNSLNLAQLAADKKYDIKTNIENWYTFYVKVLSNVGWNTQNFELLRMADANKYGSVDNVLLEIIAGHVSGQDLALIKRTIDALKNPNNEAALKLFDQNSTKGQQAKFQLGIAENSNGNAMLKFGCFNLTPSKAITKVLFLTFVGVSVEVYHSHQTMVLNNNVYAQVREAIIIKLGNNANSFVKEIEL